MFIINYIKYKLDEEIFIINGNYMEKYIIDDKLIRWLNMYIFTVYIGNKNSN